MRNVIFFPAPCQNEREMCLGKNSLYSFGQMPKLSKQLDAQNEI